jgi:Mce-associated membrane protein
MEGDAGASRLNPTGPRKRAGEPPARGGVPPTDDSTDPDSTDDEVVTVAPAESAPEAQTTPVDRPSRMSRGWFVAIFAVLSVLAAGVATGGYLALYSHDHNVAAVRAEDQAVAAAKDCVSATNAPDPATMAASVQKIVDCSTGDFGAYAKMMAPMMVEAYQAANIKVDVTDMRAGVERHNPDGSIDVLVAFRFRAPSNPDTQNQEIGLRLRALMAPEDGRYKIAKLDPVMS